MPYFYDLEYSTAAFGTAEATIIAGKNPAGGETVGIYGIVANLRSLTPGGGSVRTKSNTTGGTVFSGGTAQTPAAKNPRSPAANSTWVNGGTAITPGTTLVTRGSIGVAQTGGTGGFQPIMQQAAIQMLTGSPSNPVDLEVTTITSTAATVGDVTLELGEGA